MVRRIDYDFGRFKVRRAEAFGIAVSVTGRGWLEEIPADRPTLVVAEGLTIYLDPADGSELFRRVVDRFPCRPA